MEVVLLYGRLNKDSISSPGASWHWTVVLWNETRHFVFGCVMDRSWDDDGKPVVPIRVASMRDKNGPTSEKEKKKGWFGGGKKNQGALVWRAEKWV